MRVIDIQYKVDTASEKDIHTHLLKCKDNFTPALDTRVGVSAYSKKIRDNAVTFEAWSMGELIGLIAAYLNDGSEQTAFITNVSVTKDHMRLGIGSGLLSRCIEHARNNEFKEIRLEVSALGTEAIKLYMKHHFSVIKKTHDLWQMQLDLKLINK